MLKIQKKKKVVEPKNDNLAQIIREINREYEDLGKVAKVKAYGQILHFDGRQDEDTKGQDSPAEQGRQLAYMVMPQYGKNL